MNLIFTRSRQEQINISWEPFATSTPLKIASNKQKTVHGLPKHLLTQSEPVNLVEKFLKGLVTSNTAPGQSVETKHSATKRSKRNRLSAYFDVSLSSSDDDDGKDENKRPVIKLNSKKKTKTFKLDSEEPKALNNIKKDQSVGKSKKKRNFIKDNEKNVTLSSVVVEPDNIQALKDDNKSKIAKQGSVSENDSVSSDRGNQIPKLAEIDTMKNTKCIVTNKENVLNVSNIEEQRNFSKTSKRNTKRKDCKVLKKSVSENNNCVKSSQIPTIKSNKIITSPKKKSSKADIESMRKSRTRNVNSKLSVQVDQKKAVTPLRIWDKTNLSHQLFSDSREQEFINTLDLTSEEPNEDLKTIKSSLIQKQKKIVYSPTNTKHPSVTNQGDNGLKTKEDKPKQERPKRTIQKPKEFWIPENSLDNPNNINNPNENTRKRVKKNPKIPSKNEELVFKTESDTKSKVQEKCLEDFKDLELEGKVTRKKTKVLKREKVTPNDDVKNKITKKVQKAESNCISSGSSQKKENIIDINMRPVTESEKEVVEEEKKTVTTDKIVFSLLKDLTFKDNGLGCSAAECWNKNNFKCGVFKLKENSQVSCKTLHKNSYLNGIVIKGSLMMKVGEEELELHDGDMTFVPPLTTWQATNTGKSESVFYYWCGRFHN